MIVISIESGEQHEKRAFLASTFSMSVPLIVSVVYVETVTAPPYVPELPVNVLSSMPIVEGAYDSPAAITTPFCATAGERGW